MPLDPDDTATTARDFVLNLIAANAPVGSVIEVGLLNGDPTIGGTELDPTDCPGYARHVISDWAAFWLPAADNTLTSNPATFGAPTAEWLDAASWDCIFVDDYPWDADEMVDPLVVTAAGDPVSMPIVRTFSDSVG